MGVLESHVPWMIRGACEQGAGCLMELDGFLLVSVPSESPRRQVVSQGIQGDGPVWPRGKPCRHVGTLAASSGPTCRWAE